MATTALFLALAVPPSWARRSPCSRSALSASKGPRIYCAALTSRRLRYWSPHLEMRNLRNDLQICLQPWRRQPAVLPGKNSGGNVKEPQGLFDVVAGDCLLAEFQKPIADRIRVV